jgi:DNA-binding response OmpR family regulator
VLRLLAEAGGEPVTRERFLDLAWGYGTFPTTRTVDNHIASLRAKLEPDPAAPRWIVTVHGVGYRLDGILQKPDNSAGGSTDTAVQEDGR